MFLQFVAVLLAVVSVSAHQEEQAAPSFTQLPQSLTYPSAAFVQFLYTSATGCASDPNSLFLTSFTGNPFQKYGSLSYVDGVASGSNNLKAVEIAPSTFLWPNFISAVPPAAKLGQGIVVPDGFLVPGKSDGNIFIAQCSNGKSSAVQLTNVKSGFFYHYVQWRDMNNDGRLDIITARANKGLFSSTAELLWLEQPASNPLGGAKWKEHTLVSGPSAPDVKFLLLNDTGSSFYLVSANFFSSLLVLYEIDGLNGNVIANRTLDQSHPFYDIHLTDFSAAGAGSALVVTTHEAGQGGFVYAYELPASGDLLQGNWTKHTLASGFPVTEGGFNQAAPGFLTPFTQPGSKAPWFFLAGDGSQSAYILSPSSSSSAFDYQVTLVANVKGVVGIVAASALNNTDGKSTFAVPNYDAGQVSFYKML